MGCFNASHFQAREQAAGPRWAEIGFMAELAIAALALSQARDQRISGPAPLRSPRPCELLSVTRGAHSESLGLGCTLLCAPAAVGPLASRGLGEKPPLH